MSILVELPPEFYTAKGSTAFANFKPKTEFDLVNARAMMWMSQLAYETAQPATIAHVCNLWGFQSITPFFKTNAMLFDTRGIIAERADATIVAFAGTDPAVIENVITDATFRPKPPSDEHSGFRDAAAAIWDDVKATLAAKGKPVFVTGHSLGAAIAILTADAAAVAGFAPMALYLYGAPRVGGTSFVERYNPTLGDCTYRLVHGDDVVPCVPMSKLGFHHVGRMLHCDSNATFDPAASLEPKTGDNPHLPSEAWNAFKHWVVALRHGQWLQRPGPGPIGPYLQYLMSPIRDHLPDRYLRALAKPGSAEWIDP